MHHINTGSERLHTPFHNNISCMSCICLFPFSGLYINVQESEVVVYVRLFVLVFLNHKQQNDVYVEYNSG